MLKKQQQEYQEIAKQMVIFQEKVASISQQMNVATIPVLKKAIHNPDPLHRFAGAMAIGNRKLPMQEDLIGRLQDHEVLVQQMARLSLIKLSQGQDFGPLPGSSKNDTKKAMHQWRDWWEKKELATKLVISTSLKQNTSQFLKGHAKDHVYVLFIGNSFTQANDLPTMVAALARAGKQLPLIHVQDTPGGCTLEKHWQDGRALAKIKSRKWDYVILQEQSQMPLLNRGSMFFYAKKLDDEIKKQGAKTILYMTWALQNRPEDQAGISQAYLNLSALLNSQIAPVGNAFDVARRTNRNLALYANDKKHPSAAGTYLAACVFYAIIYGKSPEGLPGSIAQLTDSEARQLQAIAWKTAHMR